MRNLYDFQSLLYIGCYTALIVWQWMNGFSLLLYLLVLFFAIGLQVIHHNHVHLGIWKNKSLNRMTNHLISVLTAIPSAMMHNGHIKNHHVHQHGPEDVTRTYRFGGDHNHLLGYLLHPFQAFSVLMPLFIRQFFAEWPTRTRFSKELLLQVVLVSATWFLLAFLDWQKFILLVLIPQGFGLHWLLGANYLQHAHCNDESKVDFARNFTGAINWAWFNIGFHTVHHDLPKAHWSTLRTLHGQNDQHVDPCLVEKSLVAYVVRNFLLGSVFRTWRTESLRTESANRPEAS